MTRTHSYTWPTIVEEEIMKYRNKVERMIVKTKTTHQSPKFGEDKTVKEFKKDILHRLYTLD